MNKENLASVKTIKIFLNTLEDALKFSLNSKNRHDYAKQLMPWTILMTFYNFNFLNKHNCAELNRELLSLINKPTTKDIYKFINSVVKKVNWKPFVTTNTSFVTYRTSLLMTDTMIDTMRNLNNDLLKSLINSDLSNVITINLNTNQKTRDIICDEWEAKGIVKLNKALNIDTPNIYKNLLNNKQPNCIQIRMVSKILKELNSKKYLFGKQNSQAFEVVEDNRPH